MPPQERDESMKSLVAFLILCAASWAQESVPVPTSETETDSIAYDIAPLPRLVACALPMFPPLAASCGINGETTVELFITALGNVDSVRIVYCRPLHLGFEEEVLTKLDKWKFDPAIKANAPIPSSIHMTFRFIVARLSKPDEYSNLVARQMAIHDSTRQEWARHGRASIQPLPIVQFISEQRVIQCIH